MAAEYTPLRLPCADCEITFNTISSYNRHLNDICPCVYNHLQPLLELEDIAISNIDEKYPSDMIELGQICTFGNERINNTVVLIDKYNGLTNTFILYSDNLNDTPVISIKPNDSVLPMYLFERLSAQQGHIYDITDLNMIKKIEIPIIPIAQQQEYINSCSKLHMAFNLIIHGEM